MSTNREKGRTDKLGEKTANDINADTHTRASDQYRMDDVEVAPDTSSRPKE
jgi:hypothetical protein